MQRAWGFGRQGEKPHIGKQYPPEEIVISTSWGAVGGVGAVPTPSLTACPSVWAQCSATCGEGVQQRQVVCKGSDSGARCEGDKPEAIQGCHVALCPGERREEEEEVALGWGTCWWGSTPMNASSPLWL